jgi:hypothetical protein
MLRIAIVASMPGKASAYGANSCDTRRYERVSQTGVYITRCPVSPRGALSLVAMPSNRAK